MIQDHEHPRFRKSDGQFGNGQENQGTLTFRCFLQSVVLLSGPEMSVLWSPQKKLQGALDIWQMAVPENGIKHARHFGS